MKKISFKVIPNTIKQIELELEQEDGSIKTEIIEYYDNVTSHNAIINAMLNIAEVTSKNSKKIEDAIGLLEFIDYRKIFPKLFVDYKKLQTLIELDHQCGLANTIIEDMNLKLEYEARKKQTTKK